MTKAKMPVIMRLIRNAFQAARVELWTANFGTDGMMLSDNRPNLSFDRPFGAACLDPSGQTA